MEDSPTTDTPKFDDCKELAVFWADSYERRRAVEWKLSLGLWAVILTGLSSADKLSGISGLPLVLWSIAIFVVYLALWLYPNQVKNQRDRNLSYYFASQARVAAGLPRLESSSTPPAQVEKAKKRNPLVEEIDTEHLVIHQPPSAALLLLTYYSLLFHALTTLLLLVALNVIVSGHAK
jgi:hypothetical protein